MNADLLLWLSVLIFLVAMLYASVGHAGASGYIAVMSLLSLSPEFIRPTALTLNILVASLGTWQFARAGHFSWRTFWPFAALAPLTAFVGGYLALQAQVFKVIIGGVLLFSAWQLLVRIHVEQAARLPRVPVASNAEAARLDVVPPSPQPTPLRGEGAALRQAGEGSSSPSPRSRGEGRGEGQSP